MSKEVTLSAGEKLILWMLCDLFEHLDVKSEVEPAFIREAIHSGNLWGIKWDMPGVFGSSETPNDAVHEVVRYSLDVAEA